MSRHILQAQHNEQFHNNICEQFKDFYFDWKITCIFYTAIHYLKALAEHRHKTIGNSHSEIFQSIKPNSNKRVLIVPDKIYNAYYDLYIYSITARYSGITTDENTYNDILLGDHSECVKLLNYFRKYVQGQGIVPINLP